MFQFKKILVPLGVWQRHRKSVARGLLRHPDHPMPAGFIARPLMSIRKRCLILLKRAILLRGWPFAFGPVSTAEREKPR